MNIEWIILYVVIFISAYQIRKAISSETIGHDPKIILLEIRGFLENIETEISKFYKMEFKEGLEAYFNKERLENPPNIYDIFDELSAIREELGEINSDISGIREKIEDIELPKK